MKTIFTVNVPTSIAGLVRDVKVTLAGHTLLKFNSSGITTVKVIVGVGVVTTLILINFTFNKRPLAKCGCNTEGHAELGTALGFTCLLRKKVTLMLVTMLKFFTPRVMGVFVDSPSIIRGNTLVLQLRLTKVLYVKVILVDAYAFRSTKRTVKTFLLSIDERKIIFTIMLVVTLGITKCCNILTSRTVSSFLATILTIILM